MANKVADFTDEDLSQPLRTAEGRDPTIPAQYEGPFLGDYATDVTGQGLQALALPPPAPMRAPAAISTQPVAPAPPPPAPPPPAPAQGQTGLVAAYDASIAPLLQKTQEYEQGRIDELRRDQEAQAERDRATLEAAQAQARAAGQEVTDLATRQMANRPPLPVPKAEPPVPTQRIRMFGEGPEKETGFQALNRIVSTLGLMAQMGMGMKSGYAQGAMASFNGALKGWAEGNTIAAQQEWREYLANVEKMDREWAKDRQHFEDILRTDAADMGKVQTKWMVKQAEMGYAKDLIALTGRRFDERYKLLNLEAQLNQRLLQMSMQANTAMMLAQIRKDQAQQHDVTLKQIAADKTAAQALRDAERAEAQKERAQEKIESQERMKQWGIESQERMKQWQLEAQGEKKAEKEQEKGKKFDTLSSVLHRLRDDLLPRLQEKGLLPADEGWTSQKIAQFNRSMSPNDPDWREWMAHQGAMVGYERLVYDDIGARALSVYKSLLDFVENPPSQKGAKQTLDQMVGYLETVRAKQGGGQAPQAATSAGGARTVIVRDANGQIGHFNLQPGQQVPGGYTVVR